MKIMCNLHVLAFSCVDQICVNMHRQQRPGNPTGAPKGKQRKNMGILDCCSLFSSSFVGWGEWVSGYCRLHRPLRYSLCLKISAPLKFEICPKILIHIGPTYRSQQLPAASSGTNECCATLLPCGFKSSQTVLGMV